MNCRYIEKEGNGRLLEFFFELLTSSADLTIQPSDIDDSDLMEYSYVSDTTLEASKVRVCLQESDDFIMPGSANNIG